VVQGESARAGVTVYDAIHAGAGVSVHSACSAAHSAAQCHVMPRLMVRYLYLCVCLNQRMR
jgi:hypothetical protein